MAERALDQALLLVRSPGLVRRFRAAPLPDGMLQVLRIAAGDEEAIGEAVTLTARSAKTLREAATFYITQILLSPNLDSYRTLGTRAGASRDELRTHMVWLLKWLHPDKHRGEPHTVFATRVIKAWESLRTQESRDVYDSAQKQAAAQGVQAKPLGPRERPRSIARFAGQPIRPPGERRRAWRRWAVPVILGSLIASCVAMAGVYFAGFLQDFTTGDTSVSTHVEAELRRLP